jgi:hypothetical protein
MDAITSGPAAITDKQLLTHIEEFLELSGMKPTRFGIETMAEGGLVASLRSGRSLSLKNVNKVLSFIEEWKRSNPPAQPAASTADAAGGPGVPHGPFVRTSSGMSLSAAGQSGSPSLSSTGTAEEQALRPCSGRAA